MLVLGSKWFHLKHLHNFAYLCWIQNDSSATMPLFLSVQRRFRGHLSLNAMSNDCRPLLTQEESRLCIEGIFVDTVDTSWILSMRSKDAFGPTDGHLFFLAFFHSFLTGRMSLVQQSLTIVLFDILGVLSFTQWWAKVEAHSFGKCVRPWGICSGYHCEAISFAEAFTYSFDLLCHLVVRIMMPPRKKDEKGWHRPGHGSLVCNNWDRRESSNKRSPKSETSEYVARLVLNTQLCGIPVFGALTDPNGTCWAGLLGIIIQWISIDKPLKQS